MPENSTYKNIATVANTGGVVALENEPDNRYLSTYTGIEVDRAIGTVRKKESSWDNKQSKILGSQGMVVGFDSRGNPIAQDIKDFDLGNFITSWKVEIVLEAAKWSEGAQNVYIDGISVDEGAQIIHPIPFQADFNAYADSQIRVTQSLNQLKFTCEEAPLTDIRMYVVVEELEQHEY